MRHLILLICFVFLTSTVQAVMTPSEFNERMDNMHSLNTALRGGKLQGGEIYDDTAFSNLIEQTKKDYADYFSSLNEENLDDATTLFEKVIEDFGEMQKMAVVDLSALLQKIRYEHEVFVYEATKESGKNSGTVIVYSDGSTVRDVETTTTLVGNGTTVSDAEQTIATYNFIAMVLVVVAVLLLALGFLLKKAKPSY